MDTLGARPLAKLYQSRPPLRPALGVDTLRHMSNDNGSEGGRPDEPVRENGEETASAARDLADGLDLMMRAARKALRGFDAGRLEEMGRKAKQNLESLDPKAVGDLGRRAKEKVESFDRKAVSDLGRKAKEKVENLDRKTVEDLGRKAAQKLDPRNIEEVAEEAGRELIAVVERVAERVDAVVSRGIRRSSPPPPDVEERDEPAESGSKGGNSGSEPPPDSQRQPRIRIEE
jgi:hypothetical protein